MRMVLSWSDVVRPTTLGPAVFEVDPAHRQQVRNWAADQHQAHSTQRDVHSPSVEGWAVLDGGVTAVSGYGLTSLPHGVRVLGFGALRLLLADLGADAPDEPFPGEEAPTGLDELRRRHQGTAPGSPESVEQAELLATCSEAVMLRWVAITLFGEATTQRAGAAADGPEPATDVAGRDAPGRYDPAAETGPLVVPAEDLAAAAGQSAPTAPPAITGDPGSDPPQRRTRPGIHGSAARRDRSWSRPRIR